MTEIFTDHGEFRKFALWATAYFTRLPTSCEVGTVIRMTLRRLAAPLPFAGVLGLACMLFGFAAPLFFASIVALAGMLVARTFVVAGRFLIGFG